MSIATLVSLLSLAVIYVGQRLVDDTMVSNGVTIVGVVAFLVAAGLHFSAWRKTETKAEGQRLGRKYLLLSLGAVMVGLVVYAISTTEAADAFGFVGEMAQRWTGVFGAIWPIFVGSGLAGLIVMDHALRSSPIMLPKNQVKRAMSAALSAAFALALIFPVNFIAQKNNKRWDLSYFKTSEPGSATRAMLETVPSPIVVRVFQSPSNEVGMELMNYFESLAGPNLRVELVDLPSAPALSSKLRVRDNGFVSVSTEAIEKGETKPEKGKAADRSKGAVRSQTFKVGTDGDQRETKDNLRKLDQSFQETMLKLIRGRMTAYFVSGHGELNWKEGDALRKVKAFKEGIEQFNFRVKELAPSDGLAKDVPSDADVVVVLGPDFGLSKLEVASLRRYLERGGSILMAVEPELIRKKPPFGTLADDATPELLAFLGVELQLGVLTSKAGNVAITKTNKDRWHLVTSRFNTHPSVSTINTDAVYEFFVGVAGALRETKKGTGKTTATVMSSAEAWLDVDLNRKQAAEEKRESLPIAIASTGGSGDQTFRAIVVADASAFSELAMLNPGNQRFAIDGLNWLTRNESMSGETKSEEDVKFQPRKADQALWFYLTVLGLPMLFIGVGIVRLRMRYKEA